MRTSSNNNMLRVALLGGFSVHTAGATIDLGYAKLRGLLAFLVLSPGTPHRREYLAELLWPEMAEEAGRQNLRRALFNLKTVLRSAGDLISATRDTVMLARGDTWLDVDRFTTTPTSCSPSSPAPPQCSHCLSEMEQTIALYRGEFMAGFALPDCAEFEEWLLIQRESLHRRALALLEKIAQCHEQTGDYSKALPFALRITELEPWNDGAQQRVMRLYALNGQNSTALAQFDAYSRVLKSELGALPDGASRQLAERIRNGELRHYSANTARAPDLPVIPPITTERRQATVLYVELTPVTSDDPDEAMELLHTPQERCLQIIRQFSGHTVQTHGGGLLVYFGYPQAHEHAARHAVLAALAIVNGTTKEVQVRAGVHTGLVISGSDGTIPDSVGRTSKLAIQLRLSASYGEVVISRHTHDLVRGYFDCIAQGTQTADGSQPVEVFLAVRGSGARTRLDAAAWLTPIAGRKTEIAQLMSLWNKAAHGTRQIALVQGEAGIGKSRLLLTLKQRLREPHEIRELLCFPEYRQSPFHPLIAMLDTIFAFAQGDTLEERSTKLAHYIETRFPASAHEAVPLLTQLLSLPMPDAYPLPALSPQIQKEQTMQILLDLLRALATQQPVLLIVEDLHWVDPSTLELLTLFFGQPGWRAVLVLLTARPEFIPPWPKALDITIVPSSLSEQEAVEIVTAINKDLPAQTLHQILQRADGIPLFIEEMAKCAASEGQTVIPASLHDLLAARVDHMGEAKYTAQLAATIGREFDVELLRRVSTRPLNALTHHLTELQHSGLIYCLNDRSLQFKHALIQEAAYQTQTKADRQSVHRRIAQVLHDDFPEVVAHQPEIIAQHLSTAGETQQAIEYWIKAGQRAAHTSANMEAIEHFNAGLRLLARLPTEQKRDQTEFKILVNLCPVLYAAQGYGSKEATQANQRISALSKLVGNSPELFLAKWALVMNTIANAGSRLVPPIAYRLLDMAEEDPLRQQAAHYAVANAAFWLGEFELSRDHTEMGLSLYRMDQHRMQLDQFGEDLSISCMAYLCWALYFLGFPERAEQTCARMLKQARKMAHPHTLGLALCFASVLHRWLNKPVETLQLSAETIAVSRQHGFSVWLAAGEMTHGWALVMGNRDSKGVNELQSSIAGMRSAIGGISVVFLSALIESLVHLGRYDEALEQIAQAHVDVTNTGDGHFTAELYRLKGVCLLARSARDTELAESCFSQAVELSRKRGAKSLELRAAMSMARLWQQQGRPKDALGMVKEVYDRFTEGLETPLLLEATLLLQSLQEHKDHELQSLPGA